MDNFDGREPVLLVVDDLMKETNETIANRFTKGSHHRNVSVLFLVQNLFQKKQICKLTGVPRIFKRSSAR